MGEPNKNKASNNHKGGKMRRIIYLLFVLVLIAFGAREAGAYGSYLTSFNTTYGTSATVLNTCGLCHISAGGGGPTNPYGTAYASASHNFKTIEPLDSDGDGFTNLAEITARTLPEMQQVNRQRLHVPLIHTL